MFVERLKTALDDANMSQIRLAQELGFTQQAISRWCNGITQPDNPTVVKIANILGVSTDYLLGNDAVPNTELEKELKEKEALKQLLIKNGYMNDGEDLSDEELERLMKFINQNKDFIKSTK